MSSLAASRADGYYFPPDYDPAKHGSLNQFRGQHPLRERANKLDQGILVIRFEMPFNVWCGGCNHLIGKGVRFNAEKKQIGNYYSTKIWSFTMRAPCCGQKIEVQTDPKNTEYVVVSGGQRKAETWTAENAETIELPEHEDTHMAPRVDDTIARLERGESDKSKSRELNARVLELYHDSNQRHKDDISLNRMLRNQNRAQKKQEVECDKKRKSLGLSEDVKLLPESESDRIAAQSVQYGDPEAFHNKWQQKRRAIKSQSIFTPSALNKSGQNSFIDSLTPLQGDFDPEERGSNAEENSSGFGAELRVQTSFDGSDSTSSTQTDDEHVSEKGKDQSDTVNNNSACLQDPICKAAMEKKPSQLVPQNMNCGKPWKCALQPISEDTEMDCVRAEKECGRPVPKFDPRFMKKADKGKCRLQLAACSSSVSNKNLAVAQCQQKLKKTSLADKIKSALKRR